MRLKRQNWCRPLPQGHTTLSVGLSRAEGGAAHLGTHRERMKQPRKRVDCRLVLWLGNQARRQEWRHLAAHCGQEKSERKQLATSPKDVRGSQLRSPLSAANQSLAKKGKV